MNTKTRDIPVRLSVLLLSLLIALSLTACGAGEKQEASSEPDLSEESRFQFQNPPEIGGVGEGELPFSFIERIAEKNQQNSDTVGWLQMPGTSVDDVVVHYPGDENDYYLRRNFDKKTSKEGCYYADFRNTFNGTAAGLSRNTVIYGHSLDMQDDPDAPYFSQFKKLLDQDFAEAHPYIYFSVEGADLVWEIFAVYYATTELPYNTPDPSNEEFGALLAEMTKRSEYIYDVDVTANDKILTLSTCTYVFTPGVYPNKYRYVVSARLVRDTDELKETASLQKNPAPKDP